MLHRTLGNLLQSVDEFLGDFLSINSFLDHFRQPVFNTDSRAQILYQQGPFLADIDQRQADFRDSLVFLAGTGFLSKTGEGRAEQALDLVVSFVSQFLAYLGDGVGHHLFGGTGVKVGNLRQTNGRLAPGL